MAAAGAPADTERTPALPAGSVRTGGPGSRPARLLGLADRHPLWTVVLLASVARAVAAVVVGLQPGVAVPDEQQYLDLADAVASGRGAESWQTGYGQNLYDSTHAFMRPLALLVRVFGEHQGLGQLLAATFGVLTAVLTTWLALRVVRNRWAWLAGATVALLPSQVFWSSVVLRESMVWAALAGLALAVALANAFRSWRVLAGCAALAGLCLWALSDLRPQTTVVASIALVLAALVARSARRLVVPAMAVLLAVLVPWGAGLGPAGLFYVAEVVPQMATIRTNLSLGAESSFIERTPLPPEDLPVGGGGDEPDGDPGGSPGDVPADTPVVEDPAGPDYAVEETPAANLAALPRGLVAVTVRPLPWEPARNTGLLLAKVENVAWIALYGLALVGAVTGWRRRDALAFPTLITAGLIVSGAVSQANLGTAFRHRGQILWAVAVLAAVGVQYLVDRRRSADA